MLLEAVTRGHTQLTSSAALKDWDSSRDPRTRRWVAVHRRPRRRKKSPRAPPACPAAVPASDLAIATDSPTVSRRTDKRREGSGAFLRSERRDLCAATLMTIVTDGNTASPEGGNAEGAVERALAAAIRAPGRTGDR